jgi:hypothetical protein
VGSGGDESGHAQFAKGGFRPAGDHDVGQVMFDKACRIADGVGAGGAGGGDGGVGAVEAEYDRYVSAGGVGHEARDGEGADPAHAALHQNLILLFDGFDAADARADDDAGPAAVLFFEVKARVAHGG